MSSTFRFLFVTNWWHNPLVPPPHTVPSSRLCASLPEGILLVREDPRATVPTSTVASRCVRRAFFGLFVSCSNAAGAASSTSARASIATGSPEDVGSTFRIFIPSQKTGSRTSSPSVYPLPHIASGSRQRPILESTYRPARTGASWPERISSDPVGANRRGSRRRYGFMDLPCQGFSDGRRGFRAYHPRSLHRPGFNHQIRVHCIGWACPDRRNARLRACGHRALP